MIFYLKSTTNKVEFLVLIRLFPEFELY